MEEKEKVEEKKSRGLKAKLMLCLLYAAVLSTATYAWFTLNNKPKVFNLALTAAGAGDLMIADDIGGPGEYGEELDLKTATQSPSKMEEMMLNPVTTKTVETFYEPVYTGTAVTSAKEITDMDELHTKYVYEKTFYLKAGSIKNGRGTAITTGAAKKYDIMLLGPKQAEENTGCEIRQADGATSTVAGDTAANSIRISFKVEGQDVAVYEPNSDKHNTDPDIAEDRIKGEYGTYDTLKQVNDGSFADGEDGNSKRMFTIEEEQDVKVTMRVWMEGTDEDCTNSNELDEIVGNIQFISAEVKGDGR